jgi:hypothetical protein
MPQGDSRTNGVSDRESNSQPDCENHQDIGHTFIQWALMHGGSVVVFAGHIHVFGPSP